MPSRRMVRITGRSVYLRSRRGQLLVGSGAAASLASRRCARYASARPVRAPPRPRRAAIPRVTTVNPSTTVAPAWPTPRAGTMARSNPSRAASRSRRSRPGTGRSSPSSPTSPIATVPLRTGRSRSDDAEGQRDRQVQGGLLDGQAAGEVDVDVVAAQPDPGPPAEHRDEQRHPVRVDAAGRPPRRPDRTRGDERLDLDEDRPAAFERRRDHAARRGAVALVEEGACRVLHLRETAAAHLEHADLLGRAEPVLRGADDPERREALALEREHRVDEVLERLRAGQRAVLGHVADQHDRDRLRLRELRQSQRGLAHLADAARRARRARRRSRSGWSRRSRASAARRGRARRSARPRSRRRRGSWSRPGPRAARVGRPGDEPGRPTPRRSRTARSRRPRRRRRRRPGGGASTCRSPARRRRGRSSPTTIPPPRTRSSSPIPNGRRGTSGSGNGRERRGMGRQGGAVRGRVPDAAAAGLADDGLDEAVPGAAGAALALPAEERLAARLADVAALGFGGGSSHAGLPGGGRDQPASTGVSVSAAWMSRPASGSLSTTIVVPGSYLPSRRCSARTSSIMFWITRRSGRAP